MGAWDYENFSVEDMARGMITFKNGASILLESSFAANVEKNEVMNVSLMGDQGGAELFPLNFQESTMHWSMSHLYTSRKRAGINCSLNGLLIPA